MENNDPGSSRSHTHITIGTYPIDLGKVTRWVVSKLSFSTLADLINAFALLVVFILIGKIFGPALYGKFSKAYAISTTFFLLTTLGVEIVTNRDISGNLGETHKITGHALGLRLFLVIASTLVLSILSLLFLSKDLVPYIILLSIFSAAWHFGQIYLSVFAAHQRMDYLAWTTLVERGSLLLVVSISILFKADMIVVLLGFVFSGFARVIAGQCFLRKIVEKPVLLYSRGEWKRLVVDSFSLGLTNFLTIAYWRLDMILLTMLIPGNDRIVGYYSAAYTIFSGVTLLGNSIRVSTFPIIAAAKKTSPDKVTVYYRIFLVGMLILGLFCLACTYILAPFIIEIFYGASYAEAILLLRILAFASLFTYISYIGHTFFPALNLSNEYLLVVGSCAAFNFLINLIVIPHYQALGAAFTTVLTEGMVAMLSAVILYRLIKKHQTTRENTA